MAISTSLERLSYNGPDGCIATGLHRQVISETAATRTLLPEESGALCCFDLNTGVIYTLPTPKTGMEFYFTTTVPYSSGKYKFLTAAATQFLLGGVFGVSLTVGEAGDFFYANGTSHVGLDMVGTTTGGLLGGMVKVTALSTTQWIVSGYFVGSGTLADPFV